MQDEQHIRFTSPEDAALEAENNALRDLYHPDTALVDHPLPFPYIYLRRDNQGNLTTSINFDRCMPAEPEPLTHSKGTVPNPGLTSWLGYVLMQDFGIPVRPTTVEACVAHAAYISAALQRFPGLLHMATHAQDLFATLWLMLAGHALTDMGYPELAKRRAFEFVKQGYSQRFAEMLGLLNSLFCESPMELDTDRLLTQQPPVPLVLEDTEDGTP